MDNEWFARNELPESEIDNIAEKTEIHKINNIKIENICFVIFAESTGEENANYSFNNNSTNNDSATSMFIQFSSNMGRVNFIILEDYEKIKITVIMVMVIATMTMSNISATVKYMTLNM